MEKGQCLFSMQSLVFCFVDLGLFVGLDFYHALLSRAAHGFAGLGAGLGLGAGAAAPPPLGATTPRAAPSCVNLSCGLNVRSVFHSTRQPSSPGCRWSHLCGVMRCLVLGCTYSHAQHWLPVSLRTIGAHHSPFSFLRHWSRGAFSLR